MQTDVNTYLVEARKLYRATRYYEAIDYINTHFSQLSKNRADLGAGYCLQAQAYYRLDDYDNAMLFLLRALEVNPNNREAYYWLGNVYRELGFYKMAEESYRKAISIYPKEESYYLNLASVYKVQNKLSDAIASYKKMLEINPKSTKAYRNMSVCFKYNSTHHEHYEKTMNLLVESDITDERKMECYYTLGKIHQDCGNYQKAFCFMQMANGLRSQMVPFDLLRFSKKINNIIKNFDAKEAKSALDYQAEGEQLVFIIGIPRSGKSLTEQVLVHTHEVIGLGEIAVFEKILKKAGRELNKKLYYHEDPATLDKDIIALMAKEYLGETRRRSFGESKIIADTTPTNYQHLGLIANLFPKAKIIYCYRHPLDHIIQVYFKYFAEGNGFSYDLVKLAHFYVEYIRLMDFWKENIVMQMLDVNYDELIKHPRENIHRICDFVGVPMPRTLPTLHPREIGQWKHYESYLDPVKAILKARLQKGGQYE